MRVRKYLQRSLNYIIPLIIINVKFILEFLHSDVANPWSRSIRYNVFGNGSILGLENNSQVRSLVGEEVSTSVQDRCQHRIVTNLGSY